MTDPPRDRIAAFLAERTAHRLVCVLAFAGLLVAFRHLAVLLIFFVAFQRSLGWAVAKLCERTRWKRGAALGAVLGVALLVLVLFGLLGAAQLAMAIRDLRYTLPEKIAAWQHLPAVAALREHLHDTDKLVEGAQHYAGQAVGWLSALGHAALHLVVGLILAVVFVLEQKDIGEFAEQQDPNSLHGTLLRWLEHVGDAVTVTLQLQLVVAACNTLLTLPVLLLLGVGHLAALGLMIFACSLIPVIGNLISGAVLGWMAFQEKGAAGVAVFVLLTAVLHKIESYYLNPRLTARHVRLPGFLLIVSLIAWEHLLGIAGLFVSFPFLFVAGRIRAEWRQEQQPPA